MEDALRPAAGPVEEGSLSEGEKALASLPPSAQTSPSTRVEPVLDEARPGFAAATGMVIDANPSARSAAPEDPATPASRPTATAEDLVEQAAPAKEAVVVEPFFAGHLTTRGSRTPALPPRNPRPRLKLF